MLDTTSSTAFPLFGTMSSSSCGMESIVIQRPLPTESYSWSDFPIAYQDDSRTTKSPQAAATTTSPITNGCQSRTAYYDIGTNDHSSSSCSMSRSSSESSNYSMTSNYSLTSVSTTSVDLGDTIRQPQASLSESRNVRFAPSTHIRTYSLVLGDHPLCNDGLSIDLGWDYIEEEESETSNNNSNNTYGVGNSHARGKCQKRSYLSRKQLLLEVAGCTKEQLDERTRKLEAERTKWELARSYSEDYFYCLALNKQR